MAKCLRKSFGKHCFGLLLAVSLVFCCGFYSDANAASIDIGNPTLTIQRAWTYQQAYPTMFTGQVTGAPPYRILNSPDDLLIYGDLYFSVSGQFNSITTVSGGMTVTTDAISGGDWSNAMYYINLSDGRQVSGRLNIYLNDLSSNAPRIIYNFNVRLPDNVQITSMMYRLGTYCESQTVCAIPLGSGVFTIGALWARIESTNDAGDEAIIGSLDQLNNTVIQESTNIQNNIRWQGQATRESIDSVKDSVDDLNDTIKNQGAQDRADEKEEYQDQAEDVEDDINSDSSAAQGTATTLLSVVGQFITTLTSAQPTNCNLNGDLIPHLPLGNLNLCQNSPPPAITALGSLLLIAFVVPLAYHTVKRMLALIGSFQT